MKNKQKWWFYGVLLPVFVFFYLQSETWNNDEVRFWISPVSKLVGWYTSSEGVYSPQMGYYHEKLNITIEKACSGLHFAMLFYFLHLQLVWLEAKKSKVFKIMATFCLLPITFLLTILANTSRILLSLWGQAAGDIFFPPNRDHTLIHLFIGVFVFLFFLIGSYLIGKKLAFLSEP